MELQNARHRTPQYNERNLSSDLLAATTIENDEGYLLVDYPSVSSGKTAVPRGDSEVGSDDPGAAGGAQTGLTKPAPATPVVVPLDIKSKGKGKLTLNALCDFEQQQAWTSSIGMWRERLPLPFTHSPLEGSTFGAAAHSLGYSHHPSSTYPSEASGDFVLVKEGEDTIADVITGVGSGFDELACEPHHYAESLDLSVDLGRGSPSKTGPLSIRVRNRGAGRG